MIGYVRPCACCGRHGIDTPHGKEHIRAKRAAKRREKQAYKRDYDN